MILRALNDADVDQIRQWPSYSGEMLQMDYALRSQGWLDTFRGQPGVTLFAAVEGKELIGFTQLMRTGDAEAEFRIALRADKTGQGWGAIIASLTLQQGFVELGLCCIYLIVRKNHALAIRLYQRLGFTGCGECRKDIQGSVTDFLMMEKECGRKLPVVANQTRRTA